MYQTVEDLNIGDTLIIFGVTSTLINVYAGKRGFVENQEIIWTVVAKDHFAPNTVTLWATNPMESVNYSYDSKLSTYEGSALQNTCKQFYKGLPGGIKDMIVPVPLYSEEEKTYSAPEHVSVFSLNELYNKEEFERHFGKAFADEYYNEEVAVVPPYRTSREGYGTPGFWTRTPEYNNPVAPFRAYEFSSSHNNKVTNPNQKSSGAWPIGQWSGNSYFKPFINVRNNAYVTVEKFFGRYVLYDVTEEDFFGQVKAGNEFKSIYGARSFHEREWD